MTAILYSAGKRNKMNKFIAVLFLYMTPFVFGYALQYHPFLLQVKDKHGVTLAKILDKMYAEKIEFRNNRCYYIEMTSSVDIEYEIDRCKVEYTQQSVYSQADRLNGIEIKGTVWVEGNSYRIRKAGESWSEWKSSELFPSLHWFQRTGFKFRKQHGEFEFEPTNGVKRIRGSSGYVSQNRVRKIQNGEASGIVIQESGSGKIVIQESR